MNKSNQSLFFCPTPLALLNAQEAIVAYGIAKEDAILFMYTNPSKSKVIEKIELMCDASLWGKTIKIHTTVPQKFRALSLLFKTLYFRFKIGQLQNLFLVNNHTNEVRMLQKYLAHSNLIFFDDGAATLNLEKQDTKSTIALKPINRIIWGNGGSKYDLFTLFSNIKNDRVSKVVVNRYLNLKRHMSATIMPNTAAFYGQPLVKNKFCSEETYLDGLRTFISNLPNNISEVVYHPHHFEEREHVVALSKKLNIKYEYSELPPEQKYTSKDSLIPSYLGTFFSSCFFTLPSMIEEPVNYVAIDIVNRSLNSNIRSNYAFVYKELELAGVKVIEVA